MNILSRGILPLVKENSSRKNLSPFGRKEFARKIFGRKSLVGRV